MSDLLHIVLLFLLLLGASIWIGGYVTVIVVNRFAHEYLEPEATVPFFRFFGRAFGAVTGAGFALAIVTGLILLIDRGWDAGAWVATVLTVAIVLITAFGIRQARAIGVLREQTITNPGDTVLGDTVKQLDSRALAIRASLGVLTLLLLAVGSILAV